MKQMASSLNLYVPQKYREEYPFMSNFAIGVGFSPLLNLPRMLQLGRIGGQSYPQVSTRTASESGERVCAWGRACAGGEARPGLLHRRVCEDGMASRYRQRVAKVPLCLCCFTQVFKSQYMTAEGWKGYVSNTAVFGPGEGFRMMMCFGTKDFLMPKVGGKEDAQKVCRRAHVGRLPQSILPRHVVTLPVPCTGPAYPLWVVPATA